jgi:hypothetical protein
MKILIKKYIASNVALKSGLFKKVNQLVVSSNVCIQVIGM